MSYGVYTKDLKGTALQDVDLETAKRYCYGDRVVCSEKWDTVGYELSIEIHKCFIFRKMLNELHLGFISISWRKNRVRVADKIVYSPPSKD